MRIFLDLEDTVIDTWANGRLVNIEPVRFFLRLCDVSDVDVFSFAIWDDKDRDEFHSRHRDALETVLGVKFSRVLTCVDMMKSDRFFTHVNFENLHEFISMRGKNDSFVNWCLANHVGEHCILVDDVVPNRVIFDFDTKTKVETINVANISRGLHSGC